MPLNPPVIIVIVVRIGNRSLELSIQIGHYVQLAEKIIDQTERRVKRGEKVDAQDKVVSIFEPHTDIIVKDRRDTLYGHKVCLAGGVSNLIMDCWILEGNPADSDLSAVAHFSCPSERVRFKTAVLAQMAAV